MRRGENTIEAAPADAGWNGVYSKGEREITNSYGLDEFVSEVRANIAKQHSPPAVLEALMPGFERMLANATFLCQKVEEIETHSDEVCLHAEPDDGFVVLARGVSQKQTYQIHTSWTQTWPKLSPKTQIWKTPSSPRGHSAWGQ